MVFDVCSELLVVELVCRLVLAIVFVVLLYSVIDEVYELIAQLLRRQAEVLTARSNVAVLIKECLQSPINARHKTKTSYVILSASEQKRVTYVFLENDSTKIAANFSLDLVIVRHNFYSNSSI